ncbi:MAG: sigma-70 family RNA polymerase sigma factor [Actinomycetota bacterium]|nr:sigma-70 family RNA polymerase sigma factor [Actinomycetota bacterium]
MSVTHLSGWPGRRRSGGRQAAFQRTLRDAQPAYGLAGGTVPGLADLRILLAQAVGSDPLVSRTGGSHPDRSRGASRPERSPDVVDPRVVALVDLARGGDVEAFGQLYEMYVGVVYRYAFVRTGTRQAAEDITSETFMRALGRIGSFTWQGRDIGAWFITIARNLLTDRAKSARFRLEVTTADLLETADLGHPASAPGPEDLALLRSRDERLVEAIRRLTDDQAECLVLRFLHGMSIAECAQILGRNENAVKQLQLRAVRSLRKELGDAPL